MDEPAPRLYRHTAAGAVIAIVSVFAFANSGTTRDVWFGILYFLLACSVAVFFHGHRVIGHSWRDYKSRRTGKQSLARSRRWQCALRPWNNPGRTFDVQLVFPSNHEEIRRYYDEATERLAVYCVATRQGVELGRCEHPLSGAGLLVATYPLHFGGDNAPMIGEGHYRFEWFSEGDNTSIVAKNVDFNLQGRIESTLKEKELEAKIRRTLWWRKVTSPL